MKKLGLEALIEHLETLSVKCWELMQPKLLEYIDGESISIAFPVLDIYSNPRKSMQGGFISAAFDNSFGCLSFLSTGQMEMASVDISVNYHRPIFEKDTLTVTAYLKSRGRNIIHLTGEAYDTENRLIASATTNLILLEKERFHKQEK